MHFSTVIGDAWYFSRDLITFLNRNKLNWVFQSKGSRRIKIEGRWITLDSLSLSYLDSETIRISGNVYTVWEVNGKMKEIGTVKVIISEGIGKKDTTLPIELTGALEKSGNISTWIRHRSNAQGFEAGWVISS